MPLHTRCDPAACRSVPAACRSVCGTLVNFSSDVSQQPALAHLGAHPRLVEVLQRCHTASMPGAEEDAEVAGLRVSTLCVACKALFNLCAATGIGGLGVEVRQALGEALAALNEDTQLARQHPEAVQVRQCIQCLR